jgi:hypothetical protein
MYRCILYKLYNQTYKNYPLYNFLWKYGTDILKGNRLFLALKSPSLSDGYKKYYNSFCIYHILITNIHILINIYLHIL